MPSDWSDSHFKLAKSSKLLFCIIYHVDFKVNNISYLFPKQKKLNIFSIFDDICWQGL